jgi:hypothetical protein
MSKKPYIRMVPSAVAPGGQNVIFLCGISTERYLIVMQNGKCTFLDGGFSVFTGNTRAMREVNVQEQCMESQGARVRLVTSEGVLTLMRDERSGGYLGTFRGKRVRVFQSLA